MHFHFSRPAKCTLFSEKRLLAKQADQPQNVPNPLAENVKKKSLKDVLKDIQVDTITEKDVIERVVQNFLNNTAMSEAETLQKYDAEAREAVIALQSLKIMKYLSQEQLQKMEQDLPRTKDMVIATSLKLGFLSHGTTKWEQPAMKEGYPATKDFDFIRKQGKAPKKSAPAKAVDAHEKIEALSKRVAREIIDPIVKTSISTSLKIDRSRFLLVQNQAQALLNVLEENGEISGEESKQLMSRFPQTQEQLVQFSVNYGFLSPEQRQERKKAKQKPVTGDQRISPERFDATGRTATSRSRRPNGKQPNESPNAQESLESLADLTNEQLLAKVNESAVSVDDMYAEIRRLTRTAKYTGQHSAMERRKMMLAAGEKIKALVKAMGNPNEKYQRLKKMWEAKTGMKYAQTPFAKERALKNVAAEYNLSLQDSGGRTRTMADLQGDLQKKAVGVEQDLALEEERAKYGSGAPRWMWDENHRPSEGDLIMARRDTIGRTRRGARSNMQKLGVIDDIDRAFASNDSGGSKGIDRRIGTPPIKGTPRATDRAIGTGMGSARNRFGRTEVPSQTRSGPNALRQQGADWGVNELRTQFPDLAASTDPAIQEKFTAVLQKFQDASLYDDNTMPFIGKSTQELQSLRKSVSGSSVNAEPAVRRFFDQLDVPVERHFPSRGFNGDSGVSVTFESIYRGHKQQNRVFIRDPRFWEGSSRTYRGDEDILREAGIRLEKDTWPDGRTRGMKLIFTRPGEFKVGKQYVKVEAPSAAVPPGRPEERKRAPTPRVERDPTKRIAEKSVKPDPHGNAEEQLAGLPHWTTGLTTQGLDAETVDVIRSLSNGTFREKLNPELYQLYQDEVRSGYLILKPGADPQYKQSYEKKEPDFLLDSSLKEFCYPAADVFLKLSDPPSPLGYGRAGGTSHESLWQH